MIVDPARFPAHPAKIQRGAERPVLPRADGLAVTCGALLEQGPELIQRRRRPNLLRLLERLGFAQVRREATVVKGEACTDVVLERGAA